VNIDGVEYVTEERLVKHVKYNDNLQAKVKRLETSCRSWSHQHAEQGREINALTAEVERLKDRLADAVAQATPPAKPVVWVRKTETESRYGVCAVKCNEDGDKFYWDETCDIPLRAWQDIYKDIREVRVWTETCETCGQAIESEGR